MSIPSATAAAASLNSIRSQTKNIISDLEQQTQEIVEVQSWLRKEKYIFEASNNTIDTNTNTDTSTDNDNTQSYNYPTKKSRYFDTNGFLILPSFMKKMNTIFMKEEMIVLVEKEWFPTTPTTNNENNKTNSKACVFRTDEKQEEAQGKDDYFLSSSSKVHYFAEKDAIITTGEANCDLKDEYKDNKILALNKAGHGLHLLPNTLFQKYATSSKLLSLLQNDLGYIDPIIPQSMYIFKQPHIGSEVTSHQDSTFLHTSPRQTCVGFWLALDDATIENGCLWVRPKSFHEGLRRKFVRNSDYFTASGNSKDDDDDNNIPMLVFQNQHNAIDIPWEGKIPNFQDDHDITTDSSSSSNNTTKAPPPSTSYHTHLLNIGFIPIECKAGDLIVFNGEVDHFSLPNYSDKQRHTFQLHLVEGKKNGVTWDDDNWLQYPDGMSFLNLST